MAEVANREAFVYYCGSEAILLEYAMDSESAITRAIGIGNNDVLAAVRRSGRYSTTAIDALTSANAPAVLQGLALAVALHELTKGASGRPDLVQSAYDDAKSRLSLIATGNYLVEGLTAASSVGVISSLPDLRYDFNDTDHKSYARDPDL